MELPLLRDIIVIFFLAIAVILAFHRLRLPAIVGLLLTGVIAGPNGLGLVRAAGEVETIAEIGVIMLLFAIGIEFSLDNLARIKRFVFAGGTLQVALTVSGAFAVGWALGLGSGEALFLGFLASLSSTAIALRILEERAEFDAPHGRAAVGIALFQDIIAVPMVLVVPLLAGGGGGGIGKALLLLVAKGAGAILLLMVTARLLVPKLFHQIARTKSRELFLMSVLAICFAVAWLTSSIGLSLALGAFLAGLIVSESEYAHSALGSILPFRDAFMSVFFVSIGMLLDLDFATKSLPLILLITLCVIVGKSILIGAATLFTGLPIRASVMAALLIPQVGEFSFILSEAGRRYGLLGGDFYQIFLAVAVLTMIVSPLLMEIAPRISEAAARLPLPQRVRNGTIPEVGEAERKRLTNHLVIVGFGVGGKNIATAARLAGIPYVALDMNEDTVRRERARGEPIYLGDAVYEAVLESVGAKEARVVVVVISDPAATRRIVQLARTLNPGAYIVARTRFVAEMDPLYDLGADEVVPEEFEASIEILSVVLSKYMTPREEIEKFVSAMRAERYKALRTPSRARAILTDLDLLLENLEIRSLRVAKGSPAAGATPAGMRIRSVYGVNLLAVFRSGRLVPDLGADTEIKEGDVLVVMGTPERVGAFTKLLGGMEEGKT
jgi:CPA2 family monovalent cation:H+ antiporter-2